MHSFYGNTTTKASSTTSRLMSANSSCGRNMQTSDHSAYWIPGLYKLGIDHRGPAARAGRGRSAGCRRLQPARLQCGQSGSGKTYSLGLVLERLLVGTSLRMVILDPNSDYVRLSEVRGGTDPAIAAEYATAAAHREFHAPEMTHSRNLAGKTVTEHRSDSFEVMRSERPPEETQHIFNVLYFYQRLWMAIKFKNIQESYVLEMLGENFCWWYVKSYTSQLPMKWQAGRHIAELMTWIKCHADEAELTQWLERAQTLDDPWHGATGGIGSA